MADSPQAETTNLLRAWAEGDEEALNALVPRVHRELRRLAGHFLQKERAGLSLQATDLVQEVYLRLVNASKLDWQHRAHFFAVSATMMRRILLDRARRRSAAKRGQIADAIDLEKAVDLSSKWSRELIALDEVGYVPLADVGAEFLFQVVSERAERAALIVTTNLPFSEWTTVFPNPRLCKALLDRVTDRAHIIETGTESFRFRRTMEKRKKR